MDSDGKSGIKKVFSDLPDELKLSETKQPVVEGNGTAAPGVARVTCS